MNKFEIGKLLGRLEVILEDIPNKQEEIEKLKIAFDWNQNIESISVLFGRIEQKMIIANKRKEDIQFLNDLFNDIKKEYIEDFKKKRVEELKFNSTPKKALNSEGIFTVQDLSNKTFIELKNISGVSEMTARSIERQLKSNGIYLKQE